VRDTIPGVRRRRRPHGKRALPAGVLSLVLGLAGALVYFYAVGFAVGDGEAASASDRVAGQTAVGAAAGLAAAGLAFAAAGLSRPPGRALAALGLVLSAAFLAFAGVSLARSF
jgi:hypothetical protein